MAGSVPREFRTRVYYKNKTGREDFSLVVFHKPQGRSQYVIWRCISAQSSARFWYSSSVEVAASYEIDDVEIECGPFPALLGSTWKFTQDHPLFTGKLVEGEPFTGHTIYMVVTFCINTLYCPTIFTMLDQCTNHTILIWSHTM